MGLTQAQKSILEKQRRAGAGAQGVAATDGACCYLMGLIARDLGLDLRRGELPKEAPGLFAKGSLDYAQSFDDVGVEKLFEDLIDNDRNADTYFACLATLYRARLKYERILRTQPVPNVDQVGPRSLLQYGTLSPSGMLALLLWRKWFFDIDNRAAQETGYLFEPILANAIGGTPLSAKKSPVKRRSDKNKGRQVDCLRGKLAYEFKIRVTNAASGQGRWREEKEFPKDCEGSGYVPVLVVLDPTPNAKLAELRAAFEDASGHVHIGDDAWAHLEDAAGPTMSVFLEKYVRVPLRGMLEESGGRPLPRFVAEDTPPYFVLRIGEESLQIPREEEEETDDEATIPDDADDLIPGP